VASVEAGEQGAEAEITLPASAPTEPVIPGVEPTPQETPTHDLALTPAQAEALPRALLIKLPSGSYQGRTIGWVLEVGEGANEYLAYALRQPWPLDQNFKAALTLAVKAHRPDLYAAWRAEA
jgi:hypothetical protein